MKTTAMGSQLLCITVLFASVVIAVGQPSPVDRAQQHPGETPATAALMKLLRADPKNDPTWRATLADSLHAYCESVLTQVPRNTPDEDKWVENEVKDLNKQRDELTPLATVDPLLEIKPGDQPPFWSKFDEELQRQHEREQRIRSSAEAARYALRWELTHCSTRAKQLTGKQLTPAAEALLWVNLSEMFAKQEAAWPLADKLGLMSLTGCRGNRQGHFTYRDVVEGRVPDARDRNNICHWDSIAISIIDHAVIPLLEAQK
jgi:hypothetical protein